MILEFPCPSCNHNIKMSVIPTLGPIYLEAINYDPQTKKEFSPRGKWPIPRNRMEEDVKFLLDTWADKVRIYDSNGNIIEVREK